MRMQAAALSSCLIAALASLLLLVSLSRAAPPAASDILQANLADAQDASITAKLHPDLPVLGYVTPWNARGKDLVEQFVDKFDLVSPVWYTVHPEKDPKSGSPYTVRGGPPTKDDEEWLARLRRTSGKIRIVPRFTFESWSQQDYVDLLSSSSHWSSLVSSVMAKVLQHDYHGLTLESSASYLLHEPIALLSRTLRSSSTPRTLVLVMPPIRTRTSLHTTKIQREYGAQNTMILQSLPALSKLVDYFSIMTYDMAGPLGRELDLAASDVPKDSPLRKANKGSLRQPGPNTHPDWVRENLVAALKHSVTKVGDKPIQLALDAADLFDSPESVMSRQFLMGLPLYAYAYPIFWIDKATGRGVAHEPAESTQALPIIRGPAKPLTMPDVLALLRKYDPSLETDAQDQIFFDYLDETDGQEVYYRVYTPTRQATEEILHLVQHARSDESDDDAASGAGGGISLWEVGQASIELLSAI